MSHLIWTSQSRTSGRRSSFGIKICKLIFGTPVSKNDCKKISVLHLIT